MYRMTKNQLKFFLKKRVMKTRSSRVASIQSLPDTVRTTATMNRALQHVRSTMDICNRQRRTRSSPVGGVQILPSGMGIAPAPRDLDCSSDSRCRARLSPGRQSRARRRTGAVACMPAWPPAGSCCGHLSSAPAPVSDPHHSRQEKTAAAGPRRWPWEQ